MAEDFKSVLKSWRGNLSPKEAAFKLGIKMRTYYSYEDGTRTPQNLAMAELKRRMVSK